LSDAVRAAAAAAIAAAVWNRWLRVKKPTPGVRMCSGNQGAASPMEEATLFKSSFTEGR
jgi:hypothetical protein